MVILTVLQKVNYFKSHMEIIKMSTLCYVNSTADYQCLKNIMQLLRENNMEKINKKARQLSLHNFGFSGLKSEVIELQHNSGYFYSYREWELTCVIALVKHIAH